jgi:acyl-CoA dehydrogenase
MLGEALRRVLSNRCAPETVRDAEGGWLPELWTDLAGMGVPGLGIAEDRGGSGGDVESAALAVRIAAEHAAPVPLAEAALLAARLLAEAGLDVPDGAVLTCAVTPFEQRRTASGVRVSAVADQVPWASVCTHLVALAGPDVVLLRLDGVAPESGVNVAGEPRDRVHLDDAVPEAVAPAPTTADGLRARAAAARAVQIAGAADRIVELCVEHARVREQFGRPIGGFQAVAHLLARAAGAAAATQGAARLAVTALRTGDPALAGSAKIVAGEAAGTLAGLAHQVHGAIGMTREHPLHLLTRRLWAWRDEYGGERYWARRCGRDLIERADKSDDPWHDLVEA